MCSLNSKNIKIISNQFKGVNIPIKLEIMTKKQSLVIKMLKSKHSDSFLKA